MWNPSKLIVHNFLSHPDSEFSFEKDKLTMIFGKNEDDSNNGANSNGSGKSVVIEGITVALTGDTFRDINRDDFLLDGTDDGFVDFHMFNSFNKEKFRILWEFKRNNSAKVKIFENDSSTHLKKITTVAEAKKYILSKIGIDREDLLNFFIINQGNSNSFFTAGDAKQKEIIGRFANYDIVDKVIDELKDERESLSDEIVELNSEKSSQESVVESFEELIEEEKNAIEEDDSDYIEELEEEKVIANKDIKSLTVGIPDKNTYLQETKEKLKESETEKKQFDEILEAIEEVEIQQNKHKAKKRKIELSMKNISASLDHAINCPECNHEFLLDSEKSIEELEKESLQYEKELKDIKTLMAENEELMSEAESHEEALDVIKQDIKKLKRKSEKIAEEIEEDEDRIKFLKNRIESIDDMIAELKEVKEKTTMIPTYREKIAEAEKKKTSIQETIDRLSKSVEEKDYWLVHLGKKGFQTFLANKCISVIENVCNRYLEEMKVNLRVKINGFKVTQAGELRDKIEILIVKDGMVEAKFNRFSGGQKERINLAGILTFHGLINNSLNGGGLNLLCLDESLDYLDEKGQKACLKILKDFDLTTFVISHNPVENLLEDYNRILVQYSNGESKVFEDE